MLKSAIKSIYNSQLIFKNVTQLLHTSPLLQSSSVLSTDSGAIRTLTLNEPNKRNALSFDVLDSLHSHLVALRDTPSIRVVIINAKGPVFSAGHNLKELSTDKDAEFHAKVFKKCSEFMNTLCDLPQPMIAAVQGLATAAGCQLVASCDLAVAGASTRFATPGVKVGLFCSTPGVAVGRAVPRKIAMEMLLTGEAINADRALQFGLINRVVPDADVDTAALELANTIVQYSGPVLRLGKMAFNKQMRMDRESAYNLMEKVMLENLTMKDGQEGIRAFIEKRKPEWSHSSDKV